MQKSYEQVAPNDIFSNGLFYYLTSDDYDRHIYFFRTRDEEEYFRQSFVAMFNKDGSFDHVTDIMEIVDVWDYQEDLKSYKERNGWNASPS